MKISQEEGEVFLNEPRVAIINVADPGRGPLTVPVWYTYMPEDEFHIRQYAGRR